MTTGSTELIDAGGSVAARPSDVFDPRQRANPYPLYRALREAGRHHWVAPQAPRILMLTRYEDCQRILTDPALGHAVMADSPFRAVADEAGAPQVGLQSMLRANPPTHTRLRRLVSRAFTAGRVGRFGPQARQLAAELLDDAVQRGEVDLIDAFARPLPLRVICTLLGVPARDEEVFGGWASALTRGIDPDQMLSAAERAARAEATTAFAGYFTELIARRRAEPTDDLLSDLIAVQEQGDHLSGAELLELCVLLLVAGYETSVNLLAGAVLALARDPEQYAALRARPDLVPAAVEEALRFDPPIQWFGRTVLVDEVEIAGQRLNAGEGVLALAAATHRDPAVYPDPDRFDVTRYAGPTAPPRHFGFGQGIHYCLGAPLARLETEIMLGAFVERVARVEIAAEPAYRPHLSVRGPSTLPVRLTPAG
ncbi:Cytochrome P450 107B1 [Frankia canadensis]|uniref:Cytochrome P450 107B1 n=1 Tax=Frankia canadensis TaxID=1836972 RepID=A0A2I2KMT4_9ACTN|nr:cytochrome P450 [Frankia canadensis]SNQ46959.1 Cytochrome P450 107B1 [Frankia canadensis]SOU54249.1 Cytochrome P450 107B1 [Frankia canadensis]